MHRGWITCHHVVRNERLDVEESILQAGFGYGSRECQQLTPPTPQYPALDDLNHMRYTQLVDMNSLQHDLLQVNNARTVARLQKSPFPPSQVTLMEDLTQEDKRSD